MQEKLIDYSISTEFFEADGRWTAARVAIYCGSRSKIEAIVGSQNISFCPFNLVMISELNPRNDHQSHYSGSSFFCYNSAPAAAREVVKPSTDSAV